MFLAASLKALDLAQRNNVLPETFFKLRNNENFRYEFNSAIATVDNQYYPFFKPYGSFSSMKLYSFITTINLISTLDLSSMADRINDGIDALLDIAYERGGLPFKEGLTYADYGLTASFVSLLSADNVVDVLNDNTKKRSLSYKNASLDWLLNNFDRYSENKEIFSYTNAGILCKAAELAYAKGVVNINVIDQLDSIIDELSGVGSSDGSRDRYLASIRKAEWSAKINIDAITDLLTDKSVGIEKWIN
jgi:hypothetical protein